jgi:hypothetical protein
MNVGGRRCCQVVCHVTPQVSAARDSERSDDVALA